MILASFKAKVLPRLGLEASTEGTILAFTWLRMLSMWKTWQVSLRSRVRNRVRHQVPEPLVVGSAMCWNY